MARPRFSEMLLSRRRQLGLSISEAADVLRLKEEVLIAFEDGNFDVMPKSGYAQGMLASYARYLGLNPRQVTAQFSRDLEQWQAVNQNTVMGDPSATSVIAGRNTVRTRSSGQALNSSSQHHYQGSRGLLPTSGGYAGDVYDYSTTSDVRGRVSANTTRAAQAIQNRYTSQDFETTRGIGTQNAPADFRRRGSIAQDGSYVPASPQSSDQAPAAPRISARTSRGTKGSYSLGGQSFTQNERITTRTAPTQEYEDDLRLGGARPYEAASTQTGRRSSRNIARVSRPNTARTARTRTSVPQPRSKKPLHSGVLGVIEAFFMDSRRTLAFALVVAMLILTVVIITSVSSCVNKGAQTQNTVPVVPTTQTQQTQDSTNTQNSTSNSNEASSTTTTGDTARTTTSQNADTTTAQSNNAAQAQEPQPTVVEVSVAAGEVSWVEIINDAKSEVAEQITGPWSQSYTVTDTISISVNNIAAVTVTKNGETQKFETKTSGIGSITIKGTKVDPAATAATDATAAQSTNASAGTAGGTATTTTTSTTN